MLKEVLHEDKTGCKDWAWKICPLTDEGRIAIELTK
jgi:hypothetical protein